MKKYNYKYLIGIVLGIILGGGSVYAAIMYSSNAVSYDNTFSNLTSHNVQEAIDEIATNYTTLTCPSDKACMAKKTTLALGDYVRYIPENTSYTVDGTITGKVTNPATVINPSELTLWRVISINQNGTVDIISEHVSSEKVTFDYLNGFKNIVGYLNLLAEQYETEGITVGSRHFGYNGQTEYITDTTYIKSPAPWACGTGGTCTPAPQDYEPYGGGDTGYLTDKNLVENILSTSVVMKEGALAWGDYWIASRFYYYSSSTYFSFEIRYVDSSGYYGYHDPYIFTGSSFRSNSTSLGAYSHSIRPIVTLRSGLSYSGLGTEDYPMEIR